MAETRRNKTTSEKKSTAGRSAGRSSSRKTPTQKRTSSSGPKWINSPEEHEDHAGQSLATKNHEVIQHWAEERDAKPVTVASTGRGDSAGVLRLDFPGYSGSNLEEISWDEWFADFDDREVTFLFQEHLRNGRQSNFFKLVR